MSDKDKNESSFNRRDFMGAVAIASAGALLSSCAKSYPKATFLDEAPDGRALKAGLVGCGDRGSGAAQQFLRAGKDVKITALADIFEDQLTKCRKRMAGKMEVADDHCFVGFDAFKKPCHYKKAKHLRSIPDVKPAETFHRI